MTFNRITRINELLRQEIGNALFHIVQESDFDMSAVTVTHVIASHNLHNARIFISIRDYPNERKTMLSILRKHRGEFQRLINKNLTLKYTPCLSFELDTSIEQGDHILNLLSDMEKKETNIEKSRSA